MVVAVCCRCGDKNRMLRKLLLAKGGERRARGFGFPASFGLRKPDRASFSQPQHTNFPPTSTPLYSHSSTRFIRDYERQHDPPKGQQACTVSLSLARHHIRGHHNKSFACLHLLSLTNIRRSALQISSLHNPTAISPSRCRQFDPTKQSLTIPVPLKTPLSTRPPSRLAHNSLVSPASKKVCATDCSPPSPLTNTHAQRMLPRYSLPTPPSSR
jgi:hypothetical protein